MPKKLLLFSSLVALLLFVLVSVQVGKERFTQIDFDTTVKFQDRLPAQVNFPFSMISLVGSAEITTALWLTLVGFCLYRRYYLTAFCLFLFPLSVLIEVYGKNVLYHPAPPHFMYRGIFTFELPSNYYVHTNYSYPSGHVTRLSFLISFLMIFVQYYPRLKQRHLIQSGLVILLLLIFVSRIYLGEHWLSDVIGGLLLGGSFGVIAGLSIPGLKSSNG